MSRQGQNDFDQNKIAEQITNIKVLKDIPSTYKKGYLSWTYKDNNTDVVLEDHGIPVEYEDFWKAVYKLQLSRSDQESVYQYIAEVFEDTLHDNDVKTSVSLGDCQIFNFYNPYTVIKKESTP